MRDVGYQRQRALILALLSSLLLWNLPFGGLLLYPFKLMATWFHELSHGIVMLATGAGLNELFIFPDTSGMARASVGVNRWAQAAIHSAGYMGTAVAGALLLILGQTRSTARSILLVLGALVGLSTSLWVSNDFGMAFGYCAMAVFFVLAAIPSQMLAILVVNFIAAQACINAILDIRVLFRSQMIINGELAKTSDAHAMARATDFAEPWLWAVLWLVWSALCFFVALRWITKFHVATEGRKSHVSGQRQAVVAQRDGVGSDEEEAGNP